MYLNKKKRIYSKRPRIKCFNYIGPYRYFLTLSTFNRAPLFDSKKAVLLVYDLINNHAERERFKVFSLCFMPDHLHLLIEGIDEASNLKNFVSRFKQASGFIYKQSFGRKLWQTSYCEHVLRSEEYSEEIAGYILNNPVRKGLAESFIDYPYSESIWHKKFMNP